MNQIEKKNLHDVGKLELNLLLYCAKINSSCKVDLHYYVPNLFFHSLKFCKKSSFHVKFSIYQIVIHWAVNNLLFFQIHCCCFELFSSVTIQDINYYILLIWCPFYEQINSNPKSQNMIAQNYRMLTICRCVPFWNKRIILWL